jgi:protein tyrosine phosphatase (PTP) superfamily phosphohydrolase (DUF442 family)
MSESTSTPPSPTPSRGRKLRWLAVLPALVGVLFLGWYLGVRFVWFNLHDVIPGQVYRSSQPSPAFLAEMVRDHQIHCVLKLNSPNESDWSKQEADAAERLGVKYLNVRIGVSRLPRREELLSLIDAIETAPRPMLVHCKIGADRTGVASALIAMHDGATFDDAVARQLNWRFLHFGHFGLAVEDIVARYRAYCASAGKPTGGWREFVDFARNAYDPAAATGAHPDGAVLSSARNAQPQ